MKYLIGLYTLVIVPFAVYGTFWGEYAYKGLRTTWAAPYSCPPSCSPCWGRFWAPSCWWAY